MSSITLSNGASFQGDITSTILECAITSGRHLAYSCKTGQCGVCAAKVLSGQTIILKAELGLSSTQLDEGLILTCCRAASTDVTLNAEDLPELRDISRKTCPVRIETLTKINDSILLATLRTPPNNTLNFLAGQYISVIGPNGIRRSYSLANAPREDGKLELHIKKVENGTFSTYWFEQAKVNDLLRVEGPFGTFFTRTPAPKTLLLLATGTGLAPIKAILERLKTLPNDEQPQVHLYWGNRHEEDIYFDTEQLQYPGLIVHLVLSKPRPTWNGQTGYVQTLVIKNHTDLAGCEVYACGSIQMIESAKAALIKSGLPSNKFHSDAFVSS